MSGIFSLKGLEAFETAARRGSFVAAAEELSISAAAVSQLIRGLEDHVGRKLFHRIKRRVELTEAGIEIHPRLSQAFDELRRVSDELAQKDSVAALVISVAPSTAMGWLAPRLPRFVETHGWVDVSLRGEEDPVAFEKEGIDIRLSYGSSHYRSLETEILLTDAVYPVCSPSYISRHGAIDKGADLRSRRLVHTDWGPSNASFPSWQSWFEAYQLTPGAKSRRGMTANTSMAALDLARGGLGVALAQGLYCADFIESGELLVVGKPLTLPSPYSIVIPPRSHARAAMAAFKTWFVAEIRACVLSETLLAAAGTAS
ncbi:LysR family transcriptional regulator [Mesorhizobium loti R88b]|uniref:LysR family transcriptional regulator n=1 Tax=Mesorhizobium loti R88b TaxID=935548 RepID=A0A6M7WM34_RHILI|nr:LysR family transcriptional regulator [Mesorhizobium loti R88b]